jgi:starch synthase
MTALMPLYIKKIFNKDPHFSDTKVVMSLYNSIFTQNWDNRFAEKMKFDGFTDEVLSQLTEPSYVNVISTALKYADGVTIGSENISTELKEIFDVASCLKLEYQSEETQVKSLSEFLDKVIEEEILA